eukprot:9469344-Pyramimonas_sp.AAC.1
MSATRLFRVVLERNGMQLKRGACRGDSVSCRANGIRKTPKLCPTTIYTGKSGVMTCHPSTRFHTTSRYNAHTQFQTETCSKKCSLDQQVERVVFSLRQTCACIATRLLQTSMYTCYSNRLPSGMSYIGRSCSVYSVRWATSTKVLKCGPVFLLPVVRSLSLPTLLSNPLDVINMHAHHDEPCPATLHRPRGECCSQTCGASELARVSLHKSDACLTLIRTEHMRGRPPHMWFEFK